MTHPIRSFANLTDDEIYNMIAESITDPINRSEFMARFEPKEESEHQGFMEELLCAIKTMVQDLDEDDHRTYARDTAYFDGYDIIITVRR